MPWTDAAHQEPDAASAARVEARTQLTIIMTDLEVTRRLLARGRALTASEHASLIELTDDALRSVRRLAGGLQDGRRSPRARGSLPEGV